MTRVAVVIPCYNAARFIGLTLRSLIDQRFREWHAVVIDDGSTDGSHEVVASICEADNRIRAFRQLNQGVAAARNAGFKCLAATESEYVLFLDADDVLESAMLERAVGYLDAHRGVGLLHVGHSCIDEHGYSLESASGGVGPTVRRAPGRCGIRVLPSSERVTPFASLFGLCWIVPSVVLMRRAVFEQTGGFDTTMGHVYEDADLFLRMALRAPVHYLPEQLVRYRRHASQSTGNADHVFSQERKLRAKWRAPVGLTPSQREVVAAAWRFYEGRLVPADGLAAALSHLCRFQLMAAGRFLGGAVVRYVRSFFWSDRHCTAA